MSEDKKYRVEVQALYVCNNEEDAVKIREIVGQMLSEVARVSESGGGARVTLVEPPDTTKTVTAPVPDATLN